MNESFLAPLWDHARQRPDVAALVHRDQVLTWSQLAQAVERGAAAWQRRGLRPGTPVGLRLVDGPQHLVEALAIIAAGGVHVPLDVGLPLPQVQKACSDLQLRWLLLGAKDGLVDLVTAGAERHLDAEHAVLSLQPTSADLPLADLDAAFIRYTSGTTGTAKGVVLSHAAISGRADAAIAALDLQPGAAMAWVLPLAYHFAVSIGACIRSGCSVVFAGHFRAAQTARLAREAAVSHAYLSPWYVQRLVNAGAPACGPRLSQALVTTAAVDARVADALRHAWGVPIRQALGVIEVGLPALSPGELGEPAGWLGRPAPGYQLRVLDAQGTPLPAGSSGELAIAGPGLFTAYLQPFCRREEVTSDGYFRTGDAACLDAEGNLRLLGRVKDIIVVGGMKVFPLAVEAVLDSHPAVARCRVRGEVDQGTGERVVADIELQAGALAGPEIEADLASYCQQSLTTLETPARWVFTTLPLTPSGKVRRSSPASDGGVNPGV